MGLKDIVVNTRNLIDYAQDRDYRRACECCIEPPVFITLRVSCKQYLTTSITFRIVIPWLILEITFSKCASYFQKLLKFY